MTSLQPALCLSSPALHQSHMHVKHGCFTNEFPCSRCWYPNLWGSSHVPHIILHNTVIYFQMACKTRFHSMLFAQHIKYLNECPLYKLHAIAIFEQLQIDFAENGQICPWHSNTVGSMYHGNPIIHSMEAWGAQILESPEVVLHEKLSPVTLQKLSPVSIMIQPLMMPMICIICCSRCASAA